VPDQRLAIVRKVERPGPIRNRLFQALDRERSRERLVLVLEAKHLDAAIVGHHPPEAEMGKRGELQEFADRQIDAGCSRWYV
jgi:hypothetical protein